MANFEPQITVQPILQLSPALGLGKCRRVALDITDAGWLDQGVQKPAEGPIIAGVIPTNTAEKKIKLLLKMPRVL